MAKRKRAGSPNLPYMISFSGGRTSAFMTHVLLENLRDSGHDVVVCFANTGKEEEATLKFVHQCDQLWGGVVNWLEFAVDYPFDRSIGKIRPRYFYKTVTYETASRKGEPFKAIMKKRRRLPDVKHRFCTSELKIRAAKWAMLSLGYKHWINTVGFRYDEPTRWRGKSGPVPKQRWENYFPLVDMQITKPQVLAFWRTMPFDLQLKEYQGNCDVCFLKGQKKLRQIAREAPQKMDWWIRQEEERKSSFSKRYWLRDLRARVQAAPGLFDEIDLVEVDPTAIDCFCNVD